MKCFQFCDTSVLNKANLIQIIILITTEVYQITEQIISSLPLRYLSQNIHRIKMKILPIFSVICIPQIAAFSCVRESIVASRSSTNSKFSLQASSTNASGEDYYEINVFHEFLFRSVPILSFEFLPVFIPHSFIHPSFEK